MIALLISGVGSDIIVGAGSNITLSDTSTLNFGTLSTISDYTFVPAEFISADESNVVVLAPTKSIPIAVAKFAGAGSPAVKTVCKEGVDGGGKTPHSIPVPAAFIVNI